MHTWQIRKSNRAEVIVLISAYSHKAIAASQCSLLTEAATDPFF